MKKIEKADIPYGLPFGIFVFCGVYLSNYQLSFIPFIILRYWLFVALLIGAFGFYYTANPTKRIWTSLNLKGKKIIGGVILVLLFLGILYAWYRGWDYWSNPRGSMRQTLFFLFIASWVIGFPAGFLCNHTMVKDDPESRQNLAFLFGSAHWELIEKANNNPDESVDFQSANAGKGKGMQKRTLGPFVFFSIALTALGGPVFVRWVMLIWMYGY